MENRDRCRSSSRPLLNTVPARIWENFLTWKPTVILQPPSESYQRYRRCKDCSYGRRFGCNADFFRTGSQFSCHVQHLRMRRSHRCFLLYLWRNLQPACRYHGKDGDHDHICFPDASEEELNAAFKPNTKLMFGETIANPALTVLDIELFAKVAHAHGVPLVMDNRSLPGQLPSV